MGNFVLTLLVGVGGAPEWRGPPAISMAPTYHASMTACMVAGERAQRDFAGPHTGVKFSCSYRGDRYTASRPFMDW